MTPTPEQQALAEGALLIAQALGVGGAAWQVAAVAAGDGLSGPATPADVGAWAGYVKRSTPTSRTPTAPGVPAPSEEWHAIGASDQVVITEGYSEPLAVGHVLISAADETLRFRITGPIRVAGYARFLLEAM